MTLPAQVGVALALLIDAPQQLELGSQTTEMLASLRTRIVEAWTREPAPDAGVVTRAAAVAVTGVAWLAAVSLPFAESVEPPPDP
jgi:hypothetical protein